jgi:benzoyl-CoA reductase subunit C
LFPSFYHRRKGRFFVEFDQKFMGRIMEKQKALDALKEYAVDPSTYLKRWKAKTGKKILGYFCTNTPEEMIQAAGFLPVRILSSRDTISLASRHLQSYSCSLVQSSLESGLRGELSYLDGTVFPHTCDSIQRLSDIWAENLHYPFHWDLVLPVKLHTESARTYLIQELCRFRAGLENYIGHPISDADFHNTFRLFNENRSYLQEISRYQSMYPGRISAADLHDIIKTANFMAKEDHNARLKELLSQLGNGQAPSPRSVRLFLAGSVCDQPPIYGLIDSCGAALVGDDLCTGWRYFAEDVPNEGDPMEALADRLIRKVPCPCKFNPQIDRAERLLQRVQASGAQGVVFLLLKFCDPHAFDYPYLKEKLDKEKIPSLLLEIESGGLPLGAMETRLRAFVETLEA